MKTEIKKLYVGFLKYDGSVASYETDGRSFWAIFDINDHGACTMKIEMTKEMWENTLPGRHCGYRPEYKIENLQAWISW